MEETIDEALDEAKPNVFVTADQHFCHTNIIKLSNRPFASVEEMNAIMIKNWNEVVTKHDQVYILGDLFWGNDIDKFKSILRQLNGNKFLIVGNHDRPKVISKLSENFGWIKNYYELRHKRQKFVMFHYPIVYWNSMYKEAIHLHGHSHGKCPYQQRRYDVGVDCHNFAPVSIEKFMLTVKINQ